jgi:hypothetical protein
LADRAEAEHAYQLAERLGSINAASQELARLAVAAQGLSSATGWACPPETLKRSAGRAAPLPASAPAR